MTNGNSGNSKKVITNYRTKIEQNELIKINNSRKKIPIHLFDVSLYFKSIIELASNSIIYRT